jgi:hypothetical protein
VTLYDGRLILIGGFDGRTVFDDVHTLDLAAMAYLTQVQTFEIGAAVDEEEGTQEQESSEMAAEVVEENDRDREVEEKA